MNQILFGEVLIDVDEIVDARGIDASLVGDQKIPTEVRFRDGHSRLLWDKSKSAFDVWAAGRDPLATHTHQHKHYETRVHAGCVEHNHEHAHHHDH